MAGAEVLSTFRAVPLDLQIGVPEANKFRLAAIGGADGELLGPPWGSPGVVLLATCANVLGNGGGPREVHTSTPNHVSLSQEARRALRHGL